MKNFIQTSKTNNLYFVVLNEDGSLFITSDGVNSIPNAGQFILSMGGIQKVLDRCTEEITLEEFKVRAAARQAQRQYAIDHKSDMIAAQRRRDAEKAAEQIARYQALYNELLATSHEGIIEATYENISIVLAFLNTCSWGSWNLPKMTIGGSFNQYDCDGKLATTLTLNRAIDVDGEMVSKFVFGAPLGHLNKYYTCRVVSL